MSHTLRHRRPHPVVGAAVALVACLAALAGTGVDLASAKTAARTFYVDCARGSDGAAGTSSRRPWRTLARASTAKPGAGGAILIKRGTRCRGVFTAAQSGTVRRHVTLGAYGKGRRPILDGRGARAVVVLHDVQGWTVRDLAIRNGGPVTQVGVLRSAIQVNDDTLPVAAGFTIRDNVISGVDTATSSPPGANAINYGKDSGGIQLNTGSTRAFTDVLIAGNRLSKVGREGIVVRGGAPTKRLVIRGNTLHRIQGDGIVAVHAAKALIERNVLDGFNLGGVVSNAGIWAYASSDVVFQYNEVAHGANGKLDGSAFDIDGGNERLVFQYNLSRENAGGFVMFCGDIGKTSGDSIVRYNVSQDDAISAQGIVRAPLCGNLQNIQVYNNTIVTRDTSAGFLLNDLNGTHGIFTNNLFVGPAKRPAAIEDLWSKYDANLYANVTCHISNKDPHPVVGDPAFVKVGAATSRATAGGYRLRKGSPALGAGTVVAGNGGRDFFGHRVSKTKRPNIGAYQGPGVAPKAKGAKVTAAGCA